VSGIDRGIDPSSEIFASDVVVTVDVKGCARCHGDGHPGLVFRPLTYPVDVADDVAPLTHWALCPTTVEPILLRIEAVSAEEQAAVDAEADAA
jgi:hypothetical protein